MTTEGRIPVTRLQENGGQSVEEQVRTFHATGLIQKIFNNPKGWSGTTGSGTSTRRPRRLTGRNRGGLF